MPFPEHVGILSSRSIISGSVLFFLLVLGEEQKRSWPPTPYIWRDLRFGRRSSFVRYKNPGYADALLWYPICANATNCDHYTAGSSQCIFHTALSSPTTTSEEDHTVEKNPEQINKPLEKHADIERKSSTQHDTVLLNSNCQLCCNRVKLSRCKRCMIHAKFMRIRPLPISPPPPPPPIPPSPPSLPSLPPA